MGKKVHNVELSEKGIKDLITYLKDYDRHLRECTQLLVENLIEDGLTEAKKYNINTDPSGEVGEFSEFTFTVNRPETFNVKISIFYKGSQVAFIEFGAGVRWNGAVGTSPHAYGQQLGYTIGSYGHGRGEQASLCTMNC